MDRSKRYVKRLSASTSSGYSKRVVSTERHVHYILYPVVLSTINKSNDFYFHTLKLCWNDKNILKDRRTRQMFCGLHLEERLDTKDLAVSSETHWFCSSRQNDLAKIGKIAGYFIRKCAISVGQALDENFSNKSYSPIPDETFNAFIDNLKENEAIVPIVVKLEISPESGFNVNRFVCLEDDVVKTLTDQDEKSATCRTKLIKIKPEFHDWAWKLLNMRAVEERVQAIKDGIPCQVPDNISELNNPIFAEQVPSSFDDENGKPKTQNRSIRIKYANKKYSSDTYDIS